MASTLRSWSRGRVGAPRLHARRHDVGVRDVVHVGEITGRQGDMVEVEVKNKFLVGNSLELMTPQGNLSFNLEQMQNRKGELIDTAPGNGHVVYVPVPKEIDVNYGILLRNLGEREDTRQPHSAA